MFCAALCTKVVHNNMHYVHTHKQFLKMRVSLGLVFVHLFRFSIFRVFFWFSLDYSVAFVVLGLVSSVLWQKIGWEECLQNDLFRRVGCKTLIQSSNIATGMSPATGPTQPGHPFWVQ